MASAWRKLLSGGFTLRALVRELQGIRLQLTRQGDLLEAWMRAAGVPLTTTPPVPGDLADTGTSYANEIDLALVEDYKGRTLADTGREPTEDEIDAYLADEKTVALHARLAQRSALLDLERLGGNP